MRIQTELRTIEHIQRLVASFQQKYHDNNLAIVDLKKLRDVMGALAQLLKQYDQRSLTQRDEVYRLLNLAIIHRDILSKTLQKKDYQTLNRVMKILNAMMRFHRSRYSFIGFIIAWFTELFYFV